MSNDLVAVAGNYNIILIKGSVPKYNGHLLCSFRLAKAFLFLEINMHNISECVQNEYDGICGFVGDVIRLCVCVFVLVQTILSWPIN